MTFLKSTALTRAATAITATAITASAAFADLSVQFIEGAPKDRFTFQNSGTCDITDASILLDLATSPAGLVFDVTQAGAGVEVFQPFTIVQGASAIKTIPSVLDGHSKIRLDVQNLKPGETIAFTIDIDDTLGQRAITVSGSEIEGATVGVLQASETTQALFTSSANATVALTNC